MSGPEKNATSKSYMISDSVGDPLVAAPSDMHRRWTDPSLYSGGDQDVTVKKTSEREAVLADASRAVVYSRASEYGDVKVNFTRIAALWEAAFGWPVAAFQVALAMDLVKTARLTNNPLHRDSWVDKAGYAALGAEIVEGGDV